MARMNRLLSFVAGAASVGADRRRARARGRLRRRHDRVRAAATATAAPRRRRRAARRVAEIYARVSPGVVFVQANSGRGELPFPGGGRAASGSGFVIDDDGHIVTNDHVVDGATQFRVRFGENGDPIAAKLLGTDPSIDLALLKVDPTTSASGSSRSSSARPRTCGPASRRSPSAARSASRARVTSGIVSALGRTIHGAQRLLDLERRPDGRRDQPRQLGRPAARRRRPRDRRQLADPHQRRRPEHRRRLRRPGRRDQARDARSWRTARTFARVSGRRDRPGEQGGARVGDVVDDGPAAKAGLR